MRKPRAFVTDASYINTLAIVRALGEAGTEITVGERASVPRSRQFASWSRYCADSVSYPDPDGDSAGTVASLREQFFRRHYDMLIPVGLNMTELAVYHAHQFQTKVMLPAVESFQIAADKKRTFEFARSLGIPVPITVAASESSNFDCPCVIKHRRTGAYVAHSAADLKLALSKLENELDHYLLQEYIPGRNGYGYFGLFSGGRELAFYMHERLMQWPIEGGPSVAARSFYHDELRAYGRCLLSNLKWTGVAMVEFKKSSHDGKFYLMEINPKFWGSVDLAIHAGCNFPVWVRDFLTHKELRITQPYRMDTTFHWIVPNGLKSLLRYSEYRSIFLKNVLNPRVKSEIRITDPLPTLIPVMARLAGKA